MPVSFCTRPRLGMTILLLFYASIFVKGSGVVAIVLVDNRTLRVNC